MTDIFKYAIVIGPLSMSSETDGEAYRTQLRAFRELTEKAAKADSEENIKQTLRYARAGYDEFNLVTEEKAARVLIQAYIDKGYQATAITKIDGGYAILFTSRMFIKYGA